jgi:hypothetical protein
VTSAGAGVTRSERRPKAASRHIAAPRVRSPAQAVTPGHRRAPAGPEAVQRGVEIRAERSRSRPRRRRAAPDHEHRAPAAAGRAGRGPGGAAAARFGAGPRSCRRTRPTTNPGPGREPGRGRSEVVSHEGAATRTPTATDDKGEVLAAPQPRWAPGARHAAAVRPRARRGPCGGGRRMARPARVRMRSRNRASSRGGGCWAGRCACSRAGSKTAGRRRSPGGTRARPAADERRTDSRPANGTESRPVGSNRARAPRLGRGCGRVLRAVRCQSAATPTVRIGAPALVGTVEQRTEAAHN